MKAYVWMVEVKDIFGEGMGLLWTATGRRADARYFASEQRNHGIKTRVRKYGRVER